ncbi:biopolymer transporter ExbB [Plastorhodobacter daqingensis]|uniref:Biopolymer transporter ExbB n=1 Tax=Plastorhodobacter daqingensis TaxID=1387281 RepID=A0ABW2UKT7_9RHOB
MDKPIKKAEPFFSQPVRQIVMMLIVVALTVIGGYLALPRVASVFLANVWLNGFIFFVFLLGVLTCFWQVTMLIFAVGWIEGFAAERPGHQFTQAPSLLAPLAALLRSRGARHQLSASSSRSILDSVATRIDEERDITRYIVNLLIFLGLLGTFYGLATTVPAVVETIRSLSPGSDEGGLAVFDRLMSGLESQLGGMGTAFSSSLLGLAGSLVVGLLELFAGHGQNRFYRELEEWLSSITRLSLAGSDGEGVDQAALAGVIDHMAEQMEILQTIHSQSHAERAQLDERLVGLATALDRLTQRMEAEAGTTSAIERMIEGQERLIAALQGGAAGDGLDAEARMRLRSIDVQLLRIFEEMAAGRQETVADLRSDISVLTKSVRQLSRTTARFAAGPDGG